MEAMTAMAAITAMPAMVPMPAVAAKQQWQHSNFQKEKLHKLKKC